MRPQVPLTVILALSPSGFVFGPGEVFEFDSSLSGRLIVVNTSWSGPALRDGRQVGVLAVTGRPRVDRWAVGRQRRMVGGFHPVGGCRFDLGGGLWVGVGLVAYRGAGGWVSGAGDWGRVIRSGGSWWGGCCGGWLAAGAAEGGAAGAQVDPVR